MVDKKKAYETFVTPMGAAKWSNVMIAQTQIKRKDGTIVPVEPNYNIQLLLDPNDDNVIALMADIEARHERAFAEAQKAAGKKKLINQGLDNCFCDDTTKEGEPTGKLAFKFKKRAGGKKKDGTTWTYWPPVFDNQGAGVPKGTIIYGGSTAAVSFSINHNAMATGAFYTSLQLQATRFFTLKDAFSRDASSYGFTFSKPDEQAQNAFGEPADSGQDHDTVGARTDF